jgi:hypothetical protein
MNTYEWTITGMRSKDFGSQVNVVRNVNVKVIASNGTKTIEHDFVLKLENPSSDAFTSFENLTEDTVLGWVKEGMQTHIEELLGKKLDNPPKKATTALPWAS